MTYPGGKGGDGVYQRLINLMPPHRIYVEAFLGSGAIMRAKRPAEMSIGLDLDSDALQSFAMRQMPGVPGLRLVRDNALHWLATSQGRGFLGPDALLYCDPPYLMETRSCQKRLYRYEMNGEMHVELLAPLRDLPCMVMVSGYWSELYATMLRDWRAECFQAQTRGGTRTEWVWMNFPEPLELHDYRYLGCDYRERERIKKKKNRWRARLERMDPLERYAILSVIDDLHAGAPTESTRLPGIK